VDRQQVTNSGAICLHHEDVNFGCRGRSVCLASQFPQQWVCLDASDFHQKDKYERTAGKSDDLKGKEKRLIAVAAVENACAVLLRVPGFWTIITCLDILDISVTS
jgi:hypothetical protein